MSKEDWGLVTLPTSGDPEKIAIGRLKAASDMALKYYGTPLVVTTSGGKDSSVCVELALRSGIPFEVQHNHTTADAPETVRFVRQEFARLENLGFFRDSRVLPLYECAGGGTRVYRVKDTLIALRDADAARIFVEEGM